MGGWLARGPENARQCVMIMRLAILALVLGSTSSALAQPAPPPSSDEFSLRPPTLDAGKVEIHGSLPIFNTGGTFGNETLVLGGGGIAFGVNNQLEIGADYAFEVSPNADAAGLFAGHALLRLAHDSKLSVALAGGLLYSHAANDGVVFAGGLSLRYRLSRQVSVFSSSSGMPICGSCLQFLGPVTGQVLIARDQGQTAIVASLPIGIGIQATPELYLFAETVLATLILSPKTDAIVDFSDYIGVHVGGWISVGKQLDLGAGLGSELKNASDIYLVELRARIRL